MEKHDAASAQTDSNYVTSSLTPGGTFNPRIPLISALVDGTEDELVWDDIPGSLRKRIKNGTQKITIDCMSESAEAMLDFYDQDILVHVVGLQSHEKTLRKLVARDRTKEKRNPAKFSVRAGARLARSSFLGSDPFGDEHFGAWFTYTPGSGTVEGIPRESLGNP